MAKDKKSFVLYYDLIHTVKKMNREDAGELFMHILKYVNDENPETENLIVDITFEPIKQQFKRDLKKWENTLEKRSDAGKASAEARRLAKLNQQNSTNSTHVESVQQTSTKSTVNVNDNVTVNVNDNVILLEKETKENLKKSKNEIFASELLQSEQWIETVSMQNKITPSEIPKWIDDFENKLISELDNKISKKEFASHFSRWLPGEILKTKKTVQNGIPNPTFEKKQFRFSTAEALEAITGNSE